MEDNDPRNVVHYFKSERQAILLMCMLARTPDTGGKRCFAVLTRNSPWKKTIPHPTLPGENAVVERMDTFYLLCFLPEKWQAIVNPNKDECRTPPTTREMQWFVRGYLRALTGVKPTVL